MKIKRLDIKNYRQFHDFTLDLTYPAGHERAGQPLDKVCFIGQGGTGKTALIHIIKGVFLCKNGSDKNKIGFLSDSKNLFATFVSPDNYEDLGIAAELSDNAEFEPVVTNGVIEGLPMKTTIETANQEGGTPLTVGELLYFPAEMRLSFQAGRKTEEARPDPSADSHEDTKRTNNYAAVGASASFHHFGEVSLDDIWQKTAAQIAAYQKEEANFRLQLSRRAETEALDLGAAISEWKAQRPNPAARLADYLNQVLAHFNLELVTDVVDVEQAERLMVRNRLNKQTYPFEALSAGVRQFIATALPLYELQPEGSLILFDAPERSFYPDIQQMLVEQYTRFGSANQYFFATHSPIIAASFEPWEVVELVFDEEGRVCRRPYYEGEDHVDNYFLDPRYMRWDSILMQVFQMGEEGNEDFRNKALAKAARYKKQIETMKQSGNTESPEFKAKFEAYAKLAKKLGWRLQNEEDR